MSLLYGVGVGVRAILQVSMNLEEPGQRKAKTCIQYYGRHLMVLKKNIVW